jgi:hypothetical protein
VISVSKESAKLVKWAQLLQAHIDYPSKIGPVTDETCI